MQRNLLKRANENFDKNGTLWKIDGPFVADFCQMILLVDYFCPYITFDFAVRGNLIFYWVED